MPDAVMMFAAGFGTRMRPLTETRPKPLIEVGEQTLIDRTIALARAAEIPRLVANVHYKAQMLIDHLTPLGIETSHETPDILDTGGGLRAALPLLGSNPVFTTNTDAIWTGPNPFALLRAAWQPDKMDALMVCVPLTQTIGRKGGGDFSLSDQGLIARGGDYVYGGVQIIRTDALSAIPQDVFSLNLLWDQMAADDRLFGLPYPGQWCDIGHPEGIPLAEEMLSHV